MKIPWKDSKPKKAFNSESHHTACTQRQLKSDCNEECAKQVLDSLQAVEAKDAKHNEEATEKVEKFHLELGAEGIAKKRK